MCGEVVGPRLHPDERTLCNLEDREGRGEAPVRTGSDGDASETQRHHSQSVLGDPCKPGLCKIRFTGRRMPYSYKHSFCVAGPGQAGTGKAHFRRPESAAHVTLP